MKKLRTAWSPGVVTGQLDDQSQADELEPLDEEETPSRTEGDGALGFEEVKA
ncbi:MAG: hypothetical protein ACE5JX_07440 [Acidobacteriota bacterium]